MKFTDLGLAPPLLKAIQEKGYTEPSPIQEKAIPQILKGKDVLALHLHPFHELQGISKP